MNDQRAEIDWRDDRVPVSTRFDDPYFSIHDGLAETRHVFLAGNGLPGRFGGDFRIMETGFGTGLNFLTAWEAWEMAGARGTLRFTSFEAFPMSPADTARALTAFPALATRAARLVAALESGLGLHRFGEAVTLEIVVGDARKTLPRHHGRADAWFLDGFAPAKNPELWGEALLAEVASHTAPGGTLASYTAAGHVRRALAAAGLEVERAPGYGRKRHMTIARKPA
ncbi:tRNA U34 5-methylaminomethyl-2-thiouridine-forming methyltransferase MnmC [Limimaricola soesokkakensis]|uniref:tRNA 5-methylaminomethyl-2-thiouridine biosynthesis bifunctional protein MnmC n=1 Tax=Limimaricola soesokkakensis TaxID=1343159 RepID=A0A1X6YRM4_9RHOB|nr:tRNA (5-methylaminomethyl-2-thiouridine)(34)-methyltransferase MnmD [Limimaricola soesokkakensis]PSK88211.1 tRNA U34 5-methylaminomethyl-2-thiouridine-forming methyltransferase MnmC [Limimaricola soesokkakensis]SLN28518.1 tRNA 5-methylaminomethyl-2-thiouridine biosynthesis bifunctional protein MnmC [Limimaricola soesokkakensis]